MSDNLPPLLPCPFCGGMCDPQGWLGGDGVRGPECDECGATASDTDSWNRRAKLAQAQSCVPAALYVEVRECPECGHVGINEQHPIDASCSRCDWSGPSPVEDKCPGCGEEGTMSSACPECSHRTVPIGERTLQIAVSPQPQPVQPSELRHVGDSAFESWFDSYSPAGKGDKQRARDAYAAGMGECAPAFSQIDAAAKVLAERMDYPWSQMPEQGRDKMREIAQAVIEAANGIPASPKPKD